MTIPSNSIWQLNFGTLEDPHTVVIFTYILPPKSKFEIQERDASGEWQTIATTTSGPRGHTYSWSVGPDSGSFPRVVAVA